MNDTPTDDSNDHADSATQPAKRSRRRRFMIFGGMGLTAIAGLLTTRAWAHGHGPFTRGAFGHGPFGHGGMHADSAAELREHLGHAADHILGRLDATDAQRQVVGALLDREAPRLFALQQRGKTLHEQAHAAFESGDRQALELARSRGVALLDELSTVALSALQEVHDVLDPEQQAELREHMARHRGHGHHGRGLGH
jgi:hypothetical protein